MIHIRAFRVTDDIPSCERYLDGHRKVLESYGVTKVTSNNTSWLGDPNTYLIIVEDEQRQKTYGGGRVQIHSAGLPMPLVDAIAILDKNIHDFVANLGTKNVAEFCGLWNSKEMAGYGIGSIYMGRVGVAISTQLNFQYLMALASPATLRNCLKVGFEVTRELGNNGTFYYPKEDLTATGLIIRDLVNLPHANPTERIEIEKIRNNLTGVTLEKGPKGEVEFCYDLNIPRFA
ncbi:MAG: hypothetical protein LCH37_12190 [Bacteroidetes bacterium]|nr:hypothetical protein [Bacteroidota bacterium]MCK6611748.1 hypothetical protein [Bacteroidia bacterium]